MGLLQKKKRKAVSSIPGWIGGYLVYATLDKIRYIAQYIAVHYKGIEPPLTSVWWGIGMVIVSVIVGLILWRMGYKIVRGDE